MITNADFDSPFTVHADGSVSDGCDDERLMAPVCVHDDDVDMTIDGVPYRDHDFWRAVSYGYTRQDGYNGPVMHPSETLAGKLERDVLETPGVYVVVPVYGEVDAVDYAGWAVLRRDRLLTVDEAQAAGLDGTGRDGDERFPYRESDLIE